MRYNADGEPKPMGSFEGTAHQARGEGPAFAELGRLPRLHQGNTRWPRRSVRRLRLLSAGDRADVAGLPQPCYLIGPRRLQIRIWLL